MNAPDILSVEMSGIPEILCNVQVNRAFLLRNYYKKQSVVHNFFDSNLFSVKGFKNSNSLIFTLLHQQLNTNVHNGSN